MGAFLIAASRLEDYRHSTVDVTVGALMGSLVAYVVYRNYYPCLRSKSCDTPYPPKYEYAPGRGFVKIRTDEEEQRLQGTDAGIGTFGAVSGDGDDASYGNDDTIVEMERGRSRSAT